MMSKKFYKRSRSTVGNNEGERIGARTFFQNEVHFLFPQGNFVVGVLVDERLGLAPVVLVALVCANVFHIDKARAVGPG